MPRCQTADQLCARRRFLCGVFFLRLNACRALSASRRGQAVNPPSREDTLALASINAVYPVATTTHRIVAARAPRLLAAGNALAGLAFSRRLLARALLAP